MSGGSLSLTTALALLAGLVLLVLVAHGAWTTRRARPRQAELPQSGTGRVEPSLGAAAAGALAAGEGGAAGGPGGLDLPRAAPNRLAGHLDALIDAIVTLTLESPISGEAILAHAPATRRAGSKPFAIEALPAEGGQWEAPQPGRRYAELQAGVLLANRAGALNEIEYSEFVHKVQAFADAVGATPDFPDMLDVVARARELDAFAGALDAQLGLNLRARGASWSVGYVQQCAGHLGFVPGAVPGRLVRPGLEPGAPPLLVLNFDPNAALADNPHEAAVRQVALTLDVPQSPPEAEPFQLWHQVASELAKEMDADMVDDQGVPIKLAAFPAIRQEIDGLYTQLAARDLAAGSAAARRLFAS